MTLLPVVNSLILFLKIFIFCIIERTLVKEFNSQKKLDYFHEVYHKIFYMIFNRFRNENIAFVVTQFISIEPHLHFNSHKAPITGCIISTDSQFLFSTAKDELLIQHDVKTGETLQIFQGHKHEVNFFLNQSI